MQLSFVIIIIVKASYLLNFFFFFFFFFCYLSIFMITGFIFVFYLKALTNLANSSASDIVSLADPLP